MINKICVEITPNAFENMMGGVYQVRYAALNFIAKMTSSIASTVKRNQYISQMKQCLMFESTKSSKQQIMYLDFCNQIMPYFTSKQYKAMFLQDLIKHAEI
jgi:hypothetical protein